MASNNLFKSLYSTPSYTQPAGYHCSSAVDESATSFDITNSSGVITDSNGDTLASIGLDKIHAGDLSQYNIETRILRPHSCYLLQGHEYGMAYGTYYYVVPKQVFEVEGYENYINIDFDLVYVDFGSQKLHFSANTDGTEPVTDIINKLFEENGIEMVASIETNENYPNREKEKDYLVFTAQKDGYFCFLINMKMTVNIQSEDYPDSPFSMEISDIRETIYDLIMSKHPVHIDETYDKQTYEVDCALYKWMLYYYSDAIKMLDMFDYLIYVFKVMDNILNLGTMRVMEDYHYYDGYLKEVYMNEVFPDEEEGIDETDVIDPSTMDSSTMDSSTDTGDEDDSDDDLYGWNYYANSDYDMDSSLGFEVPLTGPVINRWLTDDEINWLIGTDQPDVIVDNINSIIQNSPYDDNIFNTYDVNNMIIIRDMLYSIIREYEEMSNKLPSHYWLLENFEKRIPVMKYPNGAFRGIVIIPDFPDGEEYEMMSLKVNHIKDSIGLWDFYHGEFRKRFYNVVPNAIIKAERGPLFKDVHVYSNESLSTTIDDGWANDEESMPIVKYDIERGYQNNAHDFIGHGFYGSKNNVIGLFRYMEYVNAEDLWTNIGNAYMAIAKEDDTQSKIKNLLNSLVIYNPNDIPVRIKYLTFS